MDYKTSSTAIPKDSIVGVSPGLERENVISSSGEPVSDDVRLA